MCCIEVNMGLFKNERCHPLIIIISPDNRGRDYQKMSQAASCRDQSALPASFRACAAVVWFSGLLLRNLN